MQAKEGLDGTVVEQLSGLEYIRAANTFPVGGRAHSKRDRQRRREREIKQAWPRRASTGRRASIKAFSTSA